jgi:hypothetical protein
MEIQKMARTIGLLEKNGNRLREPESKSLGDGILELRASEIELAKKYRADYLGRKE